MTTCWTKLECLRLRHLPIARLYRALLLPLLRTLQPMFPPILPRSLRILQRINPPIDGDIVGNASVRNHPKSLLLAPLLLPVLLLAPVVALRVRAVQVRARERRVVAVPPEIGNEHDMVKKELGIITLPIDN